MGDKAYSLLQVIPLVVSASIVVSLVATVVPVGRVLVLMPLLLVGLMLIAAIMTLAAGATPYTCMVAAATSYEPVGIESEAGSLVEVDDQDPVIHI